MMRHVACMTSSCAFALSSSRPGHSCSMLHLPTHCLRPLPLFVLRRRVFGLPSQGGTALAASRFPPPAFSSAHSLPATSDSARPPPRPKRNVTCYHCGILGHVERDCRKKQRGLPRVTGSGAPPFLPTPFAPQVHSAQSTTVPPSTTDQLVSASPSPADRQLLAIFRDFQ